MQFIKNELLSKGYITRNEMLKNFISRGGARLLDLKHEGWVFKTKLVKYGNGTDYQYILKSKPELPKLCQITATPPNFDKKGHTTHETQEPLFPLRPIYN